MTDRQKDTIFQYTISTALVVGTGIVLLSPQVPMIRKVSEYSAHIMLGLLLFSMMALVLKKSKVMFSGLACVGAICIFLKDASNTALKLSKENTEVNVSVAHINLSNIGNGLNEVIDFIQEDSIEIISFQELTPDWNAILVATLTKNFPYSKSEVRIDPYGMAIYSKHPFSSAHIFDCKGKPNIQITISKNDQEFDVYSSYLTPALDRQSIQKAAEELEIIADHISVSDAPVIALGEYNMVYWTNEIKNFRSKTNLTNSRRDLTQGNLRVPYDHIFFSEKLECTQFKEVRTKNLDYMGIMGSYQVKSDKPFPTLNRQLSLKEL